MYLVILTTADGTDYPMAPVQQENLARGAHRVGGRFVKSTLYYGDPIAGFATVDEQHA